MLVLVHFTIQVLYLCVAVFPAEMSLTSRTHVVQHLSVFCLFWEAGTVLHPRKEIVVLVYAKFFCSFNFHRIVGRQGKKQLTTN